MSDKNGNGLMICRLCNREVMMFNSESDSPRPVRHKNEITGEDCPAGFAEQGFKKHAAGEEDGLREFSGKCASCVFVESFVVGGKLPGIENIRIENWEEVAEAVLQKLHDLRGDCKEKIEVREIEDGAQDSVRPRYLN